jgi:hypothetical protein
VEEKPLREKGARKGEGGRRSSRAARRRGRRAERAGDGASAPAAAKEDLEREIFRGDGSGDRGSRSLCLVTVSSAAKPGGR